MRDTEPGSGRDIKEGFREEGVAELNCEESEAAGNGERSALTENAEERSTLLGMGVRTECYAEDQGFYPKGHGSCWSQGNCRDQVSALNKPVWQKCVLERGKGIEAGR